MAIFPLSTISEENLISEIIDVLDRAEDTVADFMKIKRTIFQYTPPSLKPLQRGTISWKQLYPTNIDKTHITGRGWREKDAVRDILQNALDANDEAGIPYDFSKNIIRVKFHGIIADQGPGITEEAFVIGGTKNNECYRGGFGEGLKLALGTIINKEGEPVIILTKDGYVYVAEFFSYGGKVGKKITIPFQDEWLGIIIGKMRAKPKLPVPFGTAVILPDYAVELVDEIIPHGRTIFSTKMPPMVAKRTSDYTAVLFGDCKKEYRIIEENTTRVYVGGLLFHPSKNDAMFNFKQAAYSYDLWANPATGEIESSRENYTLSGSDKMAVKFYLLWEEFFRSRPAQAVEAFSKVIKRAMEETYVGFGPVYVIWKDRVGELNVSTDYDLSKETQEALSELMTRSIEAVLHKKRDKLALLSIKPNEVGRIGGFIYDTGRLPIIYDAKWPKPKIQDFTEALYEHYKKISGEKNALDKYDDTLAEWVINAFVNALAPGNVEVHTGSAIIDNNRRILGLASVENGKAIMRVAIEAEGNFRTKKDIIKTALHELAHVYFHLEGNIGITVPDVSDAFEEALGAVAYLGTTKGNKAYMIANCVPPKNAKCIKQYITGLINETNSLEAIEALKLSETQAVAINEWTKDYLQHTPLELLEVSNYPRVRRIELYLPTGMPPKRDDAFYGIEFLTYLKGLETRNRLFELSAKLALLSWLEFAPVPTAVKYVMFDEEGMGHIKAVYGVKRGGYFQIYDGKLEEYRDIGELKRKLGEEINRLPFKSASSTTPQPNKPNRPPLKPKKKTLLDFLR